MPSLCGPVTPPPACAARAVFFAPRPRSPAAERDLYAEQAMLRAKIEEQRALLEVLAPPLNQPARDRPAS